MGEQLGLSIGAANLVAVAAHGEPVVRSAVLTVFGHRPPEVGLPSENPRIDQPGTVIADFVDRVGDPVPIVAADGSSHAGHRVVADALAALARAASPQAPAVVAGIAYPSYWSGRSVDALREAVAGHPGLTGLAGPVPVIADATASLTALHAHPGLPALGLTVLCDFGAAGTTITLADTTHGVQLVGESLRVQDFSGQLVDQLLLRHVLGGLDIDVDQTSAVTALGQLRTQCREAKERLSRQTATTVVVPVPGGEPMQARVTRAELESVLGEPLRAVLHAVDELLVRHNVPRSAVVAVATAGGGAGIPFVTQQLSQYLRVPVSTAVAPVTTAAAGVTLAASTLADLTCTSIAAAPAVTMAAAAVPNTGAHTVAAPAASSVQPLAWSEAADDTGYGIGLVADDYDYIEVGGGVDLARPDVDFAPSDYHDAPPPPLPWYRRPGLLFGAAACACVITFGGLLTTLTAAEAETEPAGTEVATAEVTVEEPTAAEVTSEPTAEPVVITQSVPAGDTGPTPDTGQTTSDSGSVPNTDQHPGGNPNTGDPNTGGVPNTGDPGAGDPTAGDPGTGDPSTGDPGTGDPDTGDPDTGDTGTGDPNTGDPDTGDPNTADPDTGDPGEPAGDPNTDPDSDPGSDPNGDQNSGDNQVPNGPEDTPQDTPETDPQDGPQIDGPQIELPDGVNLDPICIPTSDTTC